MKINLVQPLNLADPLCPICLSAPIEISVPNCFHKFCMPCLSHYVEFKIYDGQILKIPCPHTPCLISLDSDFIQAFLTEDSFKKYFMLHQKKSLEADIYFRWCPQKSCRGFDVRKHSNELICNECGHKFCFLCAATSHGQSKCKLSDDSGLVRWFWSNKIKCCPKCRVRTEKNGGCPHMVCAKCEETWCWRCGVSISQHRGNNCLLGNNGFDITWYGIILIFSAPVTLPFWTGFWILGLIVYQDILADDNDYLMRMIMKNPWIWLIISFIVSPVVIVFGLFLGLSVIAIALAIDLTPRKWRPTVTWYVFAVICVLVIACILLVIILCLAAIAICLAPLIGIVLMVFRIYYQTKGQIMA